MYACLFGDNPQPVSALCGNPGKEGGGGGGGGGGGWIRGPLGWQAALGKDVQQPPEGVVFGSSREGHVRQPNGRNGRKPRGAA